MTSSSFPSVDDLHESAMAATGLSDFGPGPYLDGLRVLVHSFATEAGLTPDGVDRFSDRLRGILEARLRMQDSLNRNPGWRDQPIEQPVFVTGLPRSGTSALHRLLCADPQSQGLEHWLTESPQPRPPREQWVDNPAYHRTELQIEQLHLFAPGFQGLHFMSADTVDECWRLQRMALRVISYASTAHLPSFTEWFLATDATPGYEIHRRALQLIGLGSQRRWVLKNPEHTLSIDALLAVYPDARIVRIHRDPRSTIASVSSMSHQAGTGMSTAWPPETAGRFALNMWSEAARRFEDSRNRHDSTQFFDVDYRDFIADSVSTVAAVHEHFGLGWSAEVEAAVRAEHAESTTGERRPQHRYRLAEYGLTEAEVDAAFPGFPGTARPAAIA